MAYWNSGGSWSRINSQGGGGGEAVYEDNAGAEKNNLLVLTPGILAPEHIGCHRLNPSDTQNKKNVIVKEKGDVKVILQGGKRTEKKDNH